MVFKRDIAPSVIMADKANELDPQFLLKVLPVVPGQPSTACLYQGTEAVEQIYQSLFLTSPGSLNQIGQRIGHCTSPPLAHRIGSGLRRSAR